MGSLQFLVKINNRKHWNNRGARKNWLFNKRVVWNNLGARKNMIHLTFRDGICILCIVSCFPSIIVNRTKLCLYVAKEGDFLNVFELLKQSDLVSMGTWSNCVFREEKTHIHSATNQPNSINQTIYDYVLHVHTLSFLNMVFLVVNQNFCFLVHCVCFLVGLLVKCGCPFAWASS